MSREDFEASVGRQVDILTEHVQKASTVLDALILSDKDALKGSQLRCLAYVAWDDLEEALDILDPGRHPAEKED
jgi:hypothetical protein